MEMETTKSPEIRNKKRNNKKTKKHEKTQKSMGIPENLSKKKASKNPEKKTPNIHGFCDPGWW